MRALATLGAALVLGAPALSAQFERRYEVGVFAAFSKYDQTFGLDDKIGGGVRLAYALGPAVTFELEALFQPPHTIAPGTRMEPIIGGGSLVLNAVNRDRLALYVLGGYSLLDFGGTDPFRFTDGGVHGGAGARFFVSDRVALRVEGRGIYTPETNGAFGQKAATHLIGSLGFAMFQADRPGADADKDRVGDKRDACPDTPGGAIVDKRGCPSDADTDGVFNGIDVCADTPRGATVDATGCPHDQDSDTVLDGLDQCPDTPAGLTVDAKGCPPDSDGDGVHDGLDKCPATPAGATVDSAGCPIDSDRDTVWDGLDKCPDTPVGAVVDATNGCPVDTDADGVFDGIDRCPDTPTGTPVDATGCPADADKDGVLDNVDRCPNTPAGTAVDGFGCPLARDSDGDGVVDPQDRCPGTPAGSRVDQFGCLLLFEERAPVTPGAPAPRPTLILRGVNFQTGRSVLTASSYAILDQVAASLVANPEIRIEIAGYTDATGAPAVNMRLSNARAQAVRAYLARKGVGPDRMVARGFGPSSPVATNSTPQGRALNRRVELHKLP